jgi:hypothetical protein
MPAGAGYIARTRQRQSSTRRTATRRPTSRGRAGARGRGRGADEGQPAHRRADGAVVVARDRAAHRAALSATCLPDGRADLPKPLIVTDAAINIVPDLEEKARHRQNAIDLAHALGIREPKVAILSAVETVNPKMPSTIDAAALCKMADRGQITGGVLDGPLAFDNAISAEAARDQGHRLAGRGRGRHPAGARSRGRQHAGQAADLLAGAEAAASCSARACRSC